MKIAIDKKVKTQKKRKEGEKNIPRHEIIKHKYIEKYPIKYFINPKEEAFLIIGTAYPCCCNTDYKKEPTKRFLCDFFYGNDYTIWELLRLTKLVKFPELGLVRQSHENHENKENEYAKKVIELLKINNVAFSDIFSTFQRMDNSACTPDNFNIDACTFNTNIMETIKGTENINTIFFTSDDTRKFFTKYIYNRYLQENNINFIPRNLPILDEQEIKIKLNDLRAGSVFFSNPNTSYFQRKIKFVTLPSPAATGGINQNQEWYRNILYENPDLDFYDAKVEYYKKAFDGVFKISETSKNL